MTRKQHGFTIVELLIVIVVIGVLTSLTAVAYSGVQKRATTSVISAAAVQWEKLLTQESTVARSLTDPGTGFYHTCLGRSINDFPAEDGFLAGECGYHIYNSLSGQRVSQEKYQESSFQNWPSDMARPSGKLPTVCITRENTDVSCMRGILLTRSGTSGAGYTELSWSVPTKDECTPGERAAPASTIQWTKGSPCLKRINY